MLLQKSKRQKVRRHDSLCKSDKRCLKSGCGRPVRDNRHGYNDPSSRPPKDLGGVSAVCATLAKGGTGGAMMPEPPAAWSIPAPGTRGKYGGINIRNHRLAFAFLSWSQPILVMLMQIMNFWR